jgi:hypothetical protein
MKQLDIALDILSDTLKSARQIAFAIAGFSVAAIYLVVLSGGALRQELAILESEAGVLKDLLDRGTRALGDLRTYYEGPVEADSLNFASFIYALEVTEFELGLALARVDASKWTQKDNAFLAFHSDLLRANVYELRAVLGGLIAQKKNRIPFDGLPVADIRDLDYHKGKDAWGLYNEFTSLRAALQTPDAYGFQASTAHLVTLESRFKHYQQLAASSQTPRTKPAKAGHTPAVSSYLGDLASAGNRSLSDAHSKMAALEKRIEEKRKQSANSLKLPFLEQPIDASTLAWVVPITTAIGMLFSVYYLNHARALHQFCVMLDPNATRAKLMYPWVFLYQPEQSNFSQSVGIGLQFAVIGSPILASLLFLWLVLGSSGLALAAATAANLLVAASAAGIVRELWLFRMELQRDRG